MNVLSSPFQRVCIASSKSRPLFQKFLIHHNKGRKTTYNNINNNHINLRFFSNSTSSSTTPSPTSLAYSRSFAYQKNGNRGSWNWSSWTRGRTGWKGASVVSTIGLGGIAVSLATYSRPAVLCEAPIRSEFSYPPSYQGSPPDLPPLPSVPQSSLKLYELGFGAITGICAGVFIKKGARALAFILGGVFVILQYFASLRMIRIDWSVAESRFSDKFYTSSTDASGEEIRRPPTVYAAVRWLIDFLTADFPPRATFVAGFALGLRVG